MAAFGFAVLAATSGCSVMMAAQGSPPATDLSGLREGLTRVEAERFVGAPLSSLRSPDGRRIDIYEVDGGTPRDQPRARLFALLDLTTLFVWEVVGTPVEAATRHARHPEQVAIVYGWDDRVVAIHRLGVTPAQHASGEGPPSGATPPVPAFGVEGGLP